MKINFKYQFIFCSLFALFQFSCSDINSPISSNDEVDPKIIGEWFMVDTVNNAHPSPNYYFHGMQITSDKNINQLGIEVNTGKVKLLDNDIYSALRCANYGILIIEYWSHPVHFIDTLNYKVEGDKLITWNNRTYNIYAKTVINALLIEPTYCNLSLQLNNEVQENRKTYYYPSSYISKISQTELQLIAFIKGYSLSITIDNFTGTGTYVIPYQKAILYLRGDDYIQTYFSSPQNNGSITIDNYDELGNVRTGRFNFTVSDSLISGTVINIDLNNGIFAVPIYQ
jgi:hypothetical protein